jgi:hypothetical protein
VFDSLSPAYSLCILLRFTELIFALESIQLSRGYSPPEIHRELSRSYEHLRLGVHPEFEKLFQLLRE